MASGIEPRLDGMNSTYLGQADHVAHFRHVFHIITSSINSSGYIKGFPVGIGEYMDYCMTSA
jgi:hypothetical protein